MFARTDATHLTQRKVCFDAKPTLRALAALGAALSDVDGVVDPAVALWLLESNDTLSSAANRYVNSIFFFFI